MGESAALRIELLHVVGFDPAELELVATADHGSTVVHATATVA